MNEQAREAVSAAVPGEPVLSVRNLVKRFGGLTAVDDVSLDIHAGEVVGLVGDNGAGKSTLIKCVSGVHHPDSGSIVFEGREVHFSVPIEARAGRHRDDLPGPRARGQPRRQRQYLPGA